MPERSGSQDAKVQTIRGRPATGNLIEYHCGVRTQSLLSYMKAMRVALTVARMSSLGSSTQHCQRIQCVPRDPHDDLELALPSFPWVSFMPMQPPTPHSFHSMFNSRNIYITGGRFTEYNNCGLPVGQGTASPLVLWGLY